MSQAENTPRITRIEVEEHDVTFFFDGSDEPWSTREFIGGTTTEVITTLLEKVILHYNDGMIQDPTV